jgi:phosphoheptose isomerase
MNKFIDELIDRYPKLESIKEDIEATYELIKNMYKDGGKLLVGGNGGSAADSEHIVGELMKGFCKKRKIPTGLTEKLENINEDLGLELGKCLQGALKAIAITGHTGLTTAFANDVDPNMIFAQQVYGYGDNKDILLCISTSGNSKNLIYAAITAKAKGMKVITLTGKDGGKLKEYSDISIIVPENETFKIQELHLPIYHALCLELEEFFFE